MGRSFSTWILLAGVFLMVAAGVFVITTIALNDSDDANGSTAASSGPDEQHVYLTNLGMTWQSCAGAVASELDGIDGVLEHETDFRGDYVELRFDANVVSIDDIMDELEGIGYRPAAYRPVTNSD